MNINTLLINNGFVDISTAPSSVDYNAVALGTVVSNLASYGYILDKDAFALLRNLSNSDLALFWKNAEPALKTITGADRNMGDYVVYKNFPSEVLEKSEAEYWIAQILMYWGLPNELFTEDAKGRPGLSEVPSLKVLSAARSDQAEKIWSNLVRKTNRWNDQQVVEVAFLLAHLGLTEVNIDDFGFKENGISAATWIFNNEGRVVASTATDALRLAASLSGGDVSLRANTRFKNFNRDERRRLLDVISMGKNIEEDFALRPGPWKRLLHALRPGDYRNRVKTSSYENVRKAYDVLYRDAFEPSYASLVEAGILNKDEAVLSVLKTRPGDFLRRFHKVYSIFGNAAVDAIVEVLPKLNTIQLVKMDRYLATISNRKTLMYPPRGVWSKAQIAANKKDKIRAEDRYRLRAAISAIVGSRLDELHPEGFDVSVETASVNIQTNDQKLAAYGRGTEFDIPQNVTFVRSASYWENKSFHNTWYDNGWNFYGDDWSPMNSCCWDRTHDVGNAAVFSGDPTNSKDLKGRACQMIDLYLDRLEKAGVRYAVWNILCYSRIPFSKATGEVLATLQWGEKAEDGKLYEPSRAQMVFPLKSEAYSSYVAYIDIKRRKLVYMDAALRANVSSANQNLYSGRDTLQAYAEYLNSLPSIHDVFTHAKRGTIPVLFSDEDREVSGKAYVFSRKNENNTFNQINLEEILGE